MPFDPNQHYQNCRDSVTQMTLISSASDTILVGSTAYWDALKTSLTAIGSGATQARSDIRAAGADGNYNTAYLSMLSLASHLIGAEILDLADDSIVDADDGFEMCRDYANTIRDPFDLGTFAALATVPRHDRLAAEPSRLVLPKLRAAVGRHVMAGELMPFRKAS